MTDIHVALVAPWQRHGGVATYAERFSEALESAGADVTPVPIEDPETPNPLAFVSLIEKLPTDADVIHVQFEAGLFGRLGIRGVGAPAFFLALARLDKPVVVTLHEVHASHGHRGPLGDLVLRLRDFVIERLALRAADATVVHTAAARRVLEARHGSGWRLERMLHPADTNADPMPTADAKAELGVDGPVALTFGYVEEKKRYEDVIRALPAFPELTYLIAGGFREGEGEAVWERCQALAKDLGVDDRLEYLGYVDEDEVPVVFSAADVVVLPYERVSQSGVVNDALAYRRPVVASSLPAFEELEGEFGCLKTYDHEDAVVEAIGTILTDESVRNQLGDAAESYIDDVNWDAFAERSCRIYTEVEARKSASHEAANEK